MTPGTRCWALVLGVPEIVTVVGKAAHIAGDWVRVDTDQRYGQLDWRADQLYATEEDAERAAALFALGREL